MHLGAYKFRYLSFIFVFTAFFCLFNTPWKSEKAINLTGFEVSCVKSGRGGTEMLFIENSDSSYKTFGFDRCEHYVSRLSQMEMVGILHRAGWGIVSLELEGKLIHQSYRLVWVMTIWWSGLVWVLSYAVFNKFNTRNKRFQPTGG
ncbi:hypothetical protein R50072_32310 [Simiduia litorea]|uniref:hypothetical protein n=1 Tax=Simiduia litorea TaxID=1435348 RepID=UPI0036F2A995